MNASDSESSGSEEQRGSLSPSAQGIKKRRLWSKQEDERLRLLVSYWGDQGGRRSNWDKIAANFEDRTPKNCRKRWFHSLDPKLRRGKWSKPEDKILKEAYEQMGPAWQRIAQLIPGRTDDQCAKRYNDVLNPAIVDRLRPWTDEEDEKLKQLREELGPKWQQISTHLPGRTGLTIRNRWRKLMRPPKPAAEDHQDISGDAAGGNPIQEQNPSHVIEGHLPFNVPGASQGAGFPAGSDPSWLHMANSQSTFNFNGPNSNVDAAAGSPASNRRFDTPLLAQLDQNLPISGTRRQFTISLGNQDAPLSFAREEHHPIAGHQLEQILDYASKSRQQIAIHQHIFQIGGDSGAASGAGPVEGTTANVVTTSTLVDPTFPETSQLNRMVQPPVQPPMGNQMAVHPSPDQLHRMDPFRGEMVNAGQSSREPNHRDMQHHQHHQQEPPEPLTLVPTPMLEPLPVERLPESEMPGVSRRGVRAQHPPDEFLNHPLLFDEGNTDPRFDADELDFLAFNPS